MIDAEEMGGICISHHDLAVEIFLIVISSKFYSNNIQKDRSSTYLRKTISNKMYIIENSTLSTTV